MKIETYITFPQINFSWDKWREAIECWKRNMEIYNENDLQFVICEHDYSAGFWIEKSGTELGEQSIILTHQQVLKYEKEMGKAEKRANKSGNFKYPHLNKNFFNMK